MSATHNMSDDEFLAAGDEVLPEEEVQPEADETENDEEQEKEEVDLEDTEEEEESEEVDDTTESDDGNSEETDETDDDETEEESQSDDEEDGTDDEDKEDTDEDTQKPTYEELEAFHTELTQDYKANGKMMPGIKDPKDFKTALSMASNYAQKTTALKGHMGRIKMLQDVTDEELNEMMDFRSRDPELIKKAMVDAKIDPIDIDLEVESKYTAKDHSVSQAEVEFDEVLDGIRETPTFAKTSEVVTKTWDEKSRQAMLAEPRLIAALNEEMEMGRFDSIQSMIEQSRSLGKNADMTDLEMYQAIATKMNEDGASEEETPVVEEKPEVKVEDPVKKAEKQKAGIVTKKKVKKTVKKHDAARLSDEEFEQLMNDGAKFL